MVYGVEFGVIPLGLVISVLSNLCRGFPFISPRFRRLRPFKVLKLILFFSFLSFFLFVCSMARGEEETSTSRARCRRGAPRESPTANNLVAVMSVEELRFFCQVSIDISLESLDKAVVSTIEWADNREQFV